MSSIRSKRVAAALAVTLAVGGLTACQPAPQIQTIVADVSPTGSTALPVVAAPQDDVVALPAMPATSDLLALAAGDALWALWFDDPSYPEKLETVIPEAARRGNVSAEALGAVWHNTSRDRMIVVLSALTQLGVPYRRYKSEVGKGFDCSGLTSWAWKQVGVNLPRVSSRQIRQAWPVQLAFTQPGDLLYYPGHIMMALGFGTAMIHAPYTGSVVEVRPMIAGKTTRLKAGAPI